MTENLYYRYFQAQKKYKPYAREEELRQDLFSFLDMVLYMGSLSDIDRETAKDSVRSAKSHMESRLAGSSQTEFYYPYLMEKMEFSQWERFVFLLALAPNYREKYGAAFANLQGDAGMRLPTLSLAVFLYRVWETISDEEISRAVQKKSVLFSYFLETSGAEGGSVLSFKMRLCGRVCAFLYGQNKLDGDLDNLAQIFCFQDMPEPMLIRGGKKEELSSAFKYILQNPKERGTVIQIYGMEGIGKRFLVKTVAGEWKTNVLFVDVARLLAGTIAEIRILFSKIMLESILFGAIICFCGHSGTDGMHEKPGFAFLLEEIRRNYLFAIWLDMEKADFLLKTDLHVLFFELPMLSMRERECLWNAYTKGLSMSGEVDLRICANQYILTPKSIKEVIRDANLHAKSQGRLIGKEDFRNAVEYQAGTQLGEMATRISSVYTWDDLVISGEQKKQLEQICNHVKYRSIVGEEWGFYEKTSYGRGICALFYGEPGTGKTMAVQVIANELGLELYRIDLSQIVSKYIGETEKNITDLFRRAKNANVLLFFDEADSLFAKRSQIKDAHDRNANAETAHLLQKLEDYEGITILATNFINNIDDAFKRRIKFMVNFVFPTPEVRLKLWKTILPKKVPLDETPEFEFFAEQFELSGSSIKEILVNAAFYAAADNRGLVNGDIAMAIKQNFAKYGKLLTKEDFGYLGIT